MLKAVIVEVLSGEEYSQYEDDVLRVPDNIEDFDTLEIDVVMECPNTMAYELGNCGAWDYLAHMWIWEDFEEDGRKSDGDTGASADTGAADSDAVDTGSSEPDLVDTGTTDAGHQTQARLNPSPSPSLSLSRLQDSGTRWHASSRPTAGSRDGWSTRAMRSLGFRMEASGLCATSGPRLGIHTIITTRFRFSNRGKDGRAQEIVHLYTGGGFNSSTTASVKRRVLRSRLTSVAWKPWPSRRVTAWTTAIAPSSAISHHYTVNGTEFVQDRMILVFRAVAPTRSRTVSSKSAEPGGLVGVAGARVSASYVIDVTDLVSPGSDASVLYQAMREGREPSDGSGNIKHNSWLVFHR